MMSSRIPRTVPCASCGVSTPVPSLAVGAALRCPGCGVATPMTEALAQEVRAQTVAPASSPHEIGGVDGWDLQSADGYQAGMQSPNSSLEAAWLASGEVDTPPMPTDSALQRLKRSESGTGGTITVDLDDQGPSGAMTGRRSVSASGSIARDSDGPQTGLFADAGHDARTDASADAVPVSGQMQGYVGIPDHVEKVYARERAGVPVPPTAPSTVQGAAAPPPAVSRSAFSGAPLARRRSLKARFGPHDKLAASDASRMFNLASTIPLAGAWLIFRVMFELVSEDAAVAMATGVMASGDTGGDNGWLMFGPMATLGLVGGDVLTLLMLLSFAIVAATFIATQKTRGIVLIVLSSLVPLYLFASMLGESGFSLGLLAITFIFFGTAYVYGAAPVVDRTKEPVKMWVMIAAGVLLGLLLYGVYEAYQMSQFLVAGGGGLPISVIIAGGLLVVGLAAGPALAMLDGKRSGAPLGFWIGAVAAPGLAALIAGLGFEGAVGVMLALTCMLGFAFAGGAGVRDLLLATSQNQRVRALARPEDPSPGAPPPGAYR